MKVKFIVSLLLLLGSLLRTTFAQFQQAKSAESVGFSSERLQRINLLIESYITKEEIPGAVTFIARHGKVVHNEAFGKMNIEHMKPMEKDAIFRVGSMGKLVTSIAVMMLFEEGKFLLTDPVAKYIPEFKEMKVAIFDKTNNSIVTTVPAKNPITIHDLLRHTSGFVYSGKYAGMDSLFKSVKLDPSNVESITFIKKLASLPLVCEPGTEWHYGYSMDVLSYFIEVISGEKFSDFCRRRIFEPSGLNKTAFIVSEMNLEKLTTHYRYENGVLKPTESPENTSYKKIPEGNTGSGWLLSTASEYALLCQLLLNRGVANGKHILGQKTVELMLTNHLSGIPSENWYRPYAGFGIGGAILTDVGASGDLGSNGMFWWAGGRNTYFFIDPSEDLIGIIMMQVTPFPNDLLLIFKNLCYQSIIRK